MKLSIITVNYNDAIGLERTLESVKTQSNTDYELLVIDGGSDDGSVEVIQEFSEYVDHWISESDDGIYNAMNKGIRAAKGEYVLFLNSGDAFYSPQAVQYFYESELSTDFIYFDVRLIKSDQAILRQAPDKLTFSFLRKQMPFHQVTFIKRELFYTFGFYDESLAIVSDWKFFILAVAKHNATYGHVPKVLSDHYHDGISADPANKELIDRERTSVLQEHFPLFVEDALELEEYQTLFQKMNRSRKIKLLTRLGIIPRL
ncbi:glycosyltransferase family 2 protein [Nonlabens xiamenensis]|uniref:glycosyltransferase family 2 protein n=1 Tax=Nonlabens xiamenensis TaxID=2341043 RepID=UPI000F60CE44|nr:glycosyltransferase family 2 protein [Nonlabens xiamenensis]